MGIANNTHSLLIGYALWIFGFTGAHRFYFGKPVSGTIWYCTFGLLGIGWLVDVVLIPGMEAKAEYAFRAGPWDYNVAWLLLTFLGFFGVHRFYMGKWISGVVYFCTIGLCGLGVIYDFWTLNQQVDDLNTGFR